MYVAVISYKVSTTALHQLIKSWGAGGQGHVKVLLGAGLQLPLGYPQACGFYLSSVQFGVVTDSGKFLKTFLY
jgi:hypothetical protein